jgi:hypothetical protein
MKLELGKPDRKAIIYTVYNILFKILVLSGWVSGRGFVIGFGWGLDED